MVKIQLIRPIITIEAFDELKNGVIFATGVTVDSSEGLNMTGSGTELTWIAKKGDSGHDWAIYTHYSGHSLYFLQTEGDKVNNRHNISNILDFNDEVWERYRY